MTISNNKCQKLSQSAEEKYQTLVDDFDSYKLDFSAKYDALKHDYEKQIKVLKDRLVQKNDEITKQLKSFIMKDIDLDEYNITSDDFRFENDNQGTLSIFLFSFGILS